MHKVRQILECDICEKVFSDESLHKNHEARHMREETDTRTYW